MRREREVERAVIPAPRIMMCFCWSAGWDLEAISRNDTPGFVMSE